MRYPADGLYHRSIAHEEANARVLLEEQVSVEM